MGRRGEGLGWVRHGTGENALVAAQVDRSEIQCLINTSVCRDYIEPATASIVHNKLGLSQSAISFDVVNACLGFLNGMLLVANMIELGQIDTGMVVAAEDPREGQLWTIDHMLSMHRTRRRCVTIWRPSRSVRRPSGWCCGTRQNRGRVGGCWGARLTAIPATASYASPSARG